MLRAIEITRVRFEFDSGTYPRAKYIRPAKQVIDAAGEEVKELSEQALRLLGGKNAQG